MNENRTQLVVLALLIVTIVGSGWDALAGPKASPEPAANSSSAVTSESGNGLSGEELWSNNCARCHNMRAPTMYTPAQWEVIVHHMRVRANITGAEQRAI